MSATTLYRGFDSAVREALRVSREWGLELVAVVHTKTSEGVRFYAVREADLSLSEDAYIVAWIEAPPTQEG